MVGSGAAQPSLDLADPPLEIVDQLKTCLDVTSPGLGEIQVGEQRHPRPAGGAAPLPLARLHSCSRRPRSGFRFGDQAHVRQDALLARDQQARPCFAPFKAVALCHGGSRESALLLQRGAVVGRFRYRIRAEQSPAAVAAAVAKRKPASSVSGE